MTKEIRRFAACDDDGNIYTVIEFETVISSREVRRDAQTPAGRIRHEYKLESGHTVHKIDAETFQIVFSKKIIWKIGK